MCTSKKAKLFRPKNNFDRKKCTFQFLRFFFFKCRENTCSQKCIINNIKMCRNHQKYLIWIFAQKLTKIVIKLKKKHQSSEKSDFLSIFKHCDVLEKMEKKGKCRRNWNINITLTAFSQCLKISEKSHSTLRAKRATFTIDKTSLKMPKMATLASFETLNLAVKQCFKSGQIGQKLMENVKIDKMRHLK